MMRPAAALIIAWLIAAAAGGPVTPRAARPRAAPRAAAAEPPPPSSAHAVLRDVVAAARGAIERCTGAGTESSGSGRVEWGTWLDDELRREAIAALDAVVPTADGEAAWAALTARFGPLDAAPVSLRVAGDEAGKRWDVLLHLLPAQSAEPPGQPGDCGRTVRPPTGALTLLKPLYGAACVTKLRRGRDERLEPVGVGTEARGRGFGQFGGGEADNTTVVLGGLYQHVAGALGRAALLEVVLKPPLADAADASAPLEALAALELGEGGAGGLAALFGRRGDPPPAPSADPAARARAESAAQSAARLASAPGGSALAHAVGGLEAQLDAIVRRVLASRADPAAARRLGVSHVRGILLSGPPGCGKTLLARELARQLGAREPQVVNGPECLSKFVGEAEANIRRLFAPAEAEWAAAGDASALHVIILDEMDAIARARGSVGGDTSGVRDSVVNQLLAKMDGVVEAPNVLVIGLTNRPELLDPALLRPGRLEVKLEVALPDRAGRRAILRIHTRAMREHGALADDARALIDGGEGGPDADAALPARTEHFSGAELAGLVRSAASFALARAALARAAEGGRGGGEPLASAAVAVRAADFERALAEVLPSLGRRDEALLRRFAQHGAGPRATPPTSGHARAQRALRLLVAGAAGVTGGPTRGRVRSALLVGAGAGAGVSALGAWAAWLASSDGRVAFARLLTPLELLGQAEGEAARCAALAERFAEARAMGRAALVLDDVDRIVGGSAAVAATLRALLREPFEPAGAAATARAGEAGVAAATPVLLVIGTCSSPAAARSPALCGLFEREAAVPLLATAADAEAALREADALGADAAAVPALAALAMAAGPLGVKHLLELVDQACALARACASDAALGEALGVRGDAAAAPLGELQLAALRACCDDRRASA